jgi:hypothetical protein
LGRICRVGKLEKIALRKTQFIGLVWCVLSF